MLLLIMIIQGLLSPRKIPQTIESLNTSKQQHMLPIYSFIL